MRLIGNFLSPYVRRVAVSLNILELPFELEEIFVFKAPHVVRRYNPLVRIPVLMLDDGANLVESGAILDEIDRMVGPEHCLTPSGGLQRRRVVQTTAIAVACAEKAQWHSTRVALGRRRRSTHLGLSTMRTRFSAALNT
jgi:glutathione S-transferase